MQGRLGHWAGYDLPPPGCLWNSLSGQVAPAAGLEPDDDVSDLQVPLLLQVGQDAGPEEDLALADAVQVAVQLQGFDLDRGEQAMYCVPPRALNQ